MAAPVDKNITFRAHIKGEIGDLLEAEGIPCQLTCSAIVSMAALLASYKEEGVSLAPSIFVCNSIEELSAGLPGIEVVRVSEGDRSDATAVRVLKDCAPLARGGWCVFFERDGEKFAYGVFSTPNIPIAVTPQEAIIEDGNGDIIAVVIRKLAENCVEIVGSRGNRRCLFFSAERSETSHPCKAIELLARVVSTEAPNAEDTRRFCYRALMDALPETHGALVAVIDKSAARLPAQLNDAVVLKEPIPLAKLVAEYHALHDNESLLRLQNAAALLKGMLSCDGITIITTDAAIVAYRCFLTLPETAGSPVGGARTRTFEALNALVASHAMRAAFVRSQDGLTRFIGD